MDDILEIYTIETVEQMRAIAGELRLRITEALARRPLTVTQLGRLLNVKPAKIHYHVRKLEKVGLVKLVETREKAGILEKYFRSVAKIFTVPGTLLTKMAPDDRVAAAQDFLEIIGQGFLRTLTYALDHQVFEGADAPALAIKGSQLWVTNEELRHLSQQIQDILDSYAIPRGVSGERERTLNLILYDTQPPGEAPAQPGPHPDKRSPHVSHGSKEEHDGP